MTLSDYNVKQRLVLLMTQSLKDPIPFAILKSYIIEQAPIMDVQKEIIKEINNLKNQEKNNRKELLTEEFLTQQLQADNDEQGIAEKEKRRLTREKESISTKIAQYRINIYQQQFATVQHPASNSIVHSHQTQTVFQHQASMDNILTQSNIIMLQQNLHRCIKRQEEIDTLLSQQNEADARRAARFRARVNNDMDNALSSENQSRLRKALSNAYSELDKKANQLINDAQSSNYLTFKEQLETSLETLLLSENEKKALRQLCDLITEYNNLKNQADTLNNQLYLSKQQLTNTKKALNSTIEKQKNLAASIPMCNKEIVRLQNDNEKVNQHLQQNKIQQQQLFKSTLYALFLLIAVSSLMLVAYPFSPILLPTIALASAPFLGITVATITFAIKVRFNQQVLDTNSRTISENKTQISQNQNELDTISLKSYEQQIAELTVSINQQENNLAALQGQMQSLLDSAIKVTPSNTTVTSNASSFFATATAIPVIDAFEVTVVPENDDYYEQKQASAPSF